MSDITFSKIAWDEYVYWQSQDKKTINKINQLLKDIQRDPMGGTGKPEPLKNSNAWSRRIDHKNRLVYKINDKNEIYILSCEGHYEN